MNADLLIVASGTSSPLYTDGPIPTDGQPEWLRCTDSECGHRQDPWCALDWCDNDHQGAPDGPFPVPAARWAELGLLVCEHGHEFDTDNPFRTAGDLCDGVLGARRRCGAILAVVGAIVELVEVTGPSHHADECVKLRPIHGPRATEPENIIWCQTDAIRGCWHTPTGEVTPLPQPIPCDRPTRATVKVCRDARPTIEGNLPASHWWADEGTAARIREVTA